MSWRGGGPCIAQFRRGWVPGFGGASSCAWRGGVAWGGLRPDRSLAAGCGAGRGWGWPWGPAAWVACGRVCGPGVDLVVTGWVLEVDMPPRWSSVMAGRLALAAASRNRRRGRVADFGGASSCAGPGRVTAPETGDWRVRVGGSPVRQARGRPWGSLRSDPVSAAGLVGGGVRGSPEGWPEAVVSLLRVPVGLASGSTQSHHRGSPQTRPSPLGAARGSLRQPECPQPGTAPGGEVRAIGPEAHRRQAVTRTTTHHQPRAVALQPCPAAPPARPRTLTTPGGRQRGVTRRAATG